MAIAAGKFRHRVTIQQPQNNQDPETGENIVSWVDTVWTRIPAAIEPLSAREFIASQTQQSKISLRITIRYRTGMNATMRLINNRTSEIYNIEGVLPDNIYNNEYITLPCSAGVNDGE